MKSRKHSKVHSCGAGLCPHAERATGNLYRPTRGTCNGSHPIVLIRIDPVVPKNNFRKANLYQGTRGADQGIFHKWTLNRVTATGNLYRPARGTCNGYHRKATDPHAERATGITEKRPTRNRNPICINICKPERGGNGGVSKTCGFEPNPTYWFSNGWIVK